MVSKTPVPGLAVVCNQAGTILQVFRDDIGLSVTNPIIGRPITALVDPNDVTKALNFLVELKNQQAAFEWELNVGTPQGITTLRFGGVANGEQLLIVAAKTGTQVMQLYEELMLINNEQINTLRQTIKNQIQYAQAQATRDSELYDEISRLNNELVNLQRELAKKNAALQLLNEQKNRFLGMASHDLLNPLTIILAYSEVLAQVESVMVDEESQKMIAAIQQSSNFMLSLVNNFLDVATIEAGKMELRLEATDIVTLVEHNLFLNKVLAGRKNINLELTIAGHNYPKLMIDPQKIEQVLNNFVSNALKFSYPDSTITVKLERNETEVVVTVEDEGQGIPAAEMSYLFNPFQKTSVRSTSGEKSSGLGLAIARKVIEGHKGRIWADSTVGKGSVFAFSLPALQLSEEIGPEDNLPTITADEISQLPRDWLMAFEQIIVILDPAAAKDMVQQIETDHPAVAIKLLALIDTLRMDIILDLLRSTLSAYPR